MKLSTRELSKVKFIDFHTHKNNFPPKTLSVISVELGDVESLALENLDYKFFSVGLHPWRLPSNTDNLEKDLIALRKPLKLHKVIAIGEVGLDRLWGPPPMVQKTYFIAILKLAKELNKPMIVHCVRYYPELIAIKTQCAPDLKVLVHGYNGKVEILEQLFKHNFYVSLGSLSLKRDNIYEFILQNPQYLNRICLETDDSGINIKEIYKRAAKVLKIDIKELEQLMKTNFISLFQDTTNV